MPGLLSTCSRGDRDPGERFPFRGRIRSFQNASRCPNNPSTSTVLSSTASAALPLVRRWANAQPNQPRLATDDVFGQPRKHCIKQVRGAPSPQRIRVVKSQPAHAFTSRLKGIPTIFLIDDSVNHRSQANGSGNAKKTSTVSPSGAHVGTPVPHHRIQRMG